MVESLVNSAVLFLRESPSPAKHQLQAVDLLEHILTLAEPLLGTFDPLCSHRVSCNAISFHIPLHRCIGLMMHAILSCAGLKVSLRHLLRSSTGGRETFWRSIISRPLQIMALASQVYAGLWVRNGQIMNTQLQYRMFHQWHDVGMDIDYMLVQLASLVVSNSIVPRLLRTFEIDRILLAGVSCMGLESTEPDLDKWLRVAAYGMQCLIVLASEARRLGHTERQMAKKELINILASADQCKRTFSQLSQRIATRLTKLSNFKSLLMSVADYHKPIGQTNGFFTLKPQLWEFVDPYFYHLTRPERQQLEQNFSTFEQRRLRSTQTESKLRPPFLNPPVLETVSPLNLWAGVARQVHRKMLWQPHFHAIVFSVLYSTMRRTHLFQVDILGHTLYALALSLQLTEECEAVESPAAGTASDADGAACAVSSASASKASTESSLGAGPFACSPYRACWQLFAPPYPACSASATSIAQMLSELLLGQDDVRDMGSRIEHIFSLLKRHSPEMAVRVEKLVATSTKDADAAQQQQKDKEQAAREQRDAFMAKMDQQALNFDMSNIGDSSDSGSDSDSDSGSSSNSDSENECGEGDSGHSEEAKEVQKEKEEAEAKPKDEAKQDIECVLCRGSADSPFGLVCFAQLTTVLKHQKEQTEKGALGKHTPFATEETSTSNRTSLPSVASTPTASVNSSSDFPDTDVFLREGVLDRFANDFTSGRSRAVHIGTCGHYLHMSCFREYYKTLRERHEAGHNFDGKQVPTQNTTLSACGHLSHYPRTHPYRSSK